MIAPISNSAENRFLGQSGSSDTLSAPADRPIESRQILRQNSLNAVGWMRSFFQGPSDGVISQALSAVAQQIEAGVSLNQALTESGLRSEIQQRLGPSLLQKILGMVKERNADVLETSTLGLASQLRKDQPQVAQGILSVLQQDPHVSKETREQALAAYNANAEQGPISGRLGHWMQDTVEHMSGLGMVPVIGATAFGRTFETIILSRLGPVATGMGARLLVGAASLGLETTVAASGTYALNGGEVPLGLRGWATSLTALRLSGVAGNFLVKSMNRLGVARGVQSLAKTLVPHVAMYTGLYATNLAEGRSPDAIGLMGSVLSMQLAAGVGRGPLRLIEGLRGELEIRREISRYTSEPNAGTGFASPFGEPLGATNSLNITSSGKIKRSSVLEDVLAARPAMMSIDDERDDGRLVGEAPAWQEAASIRSSRALEPLAENAKVVGLETDNAGSGGPKNSDQEIVNEWNQRWLNEASNASRRSILIRSQNKMISQLAGHAITGNLAAMDVLTEKAGRGFLHAVYALEFIAMPRNPLFSDKPPPPQISTAARQALQNLEISKTLVRQAKRSQSAPVLEILALYGNTDAANRLLEMARVRGKSKRPRSIRELQALAINQGKLGAVAVLAGRVNSGDPEVIWALGNIANFYDFKISNGYHPPYRKTSMAARQVLLSFDKAEKATGLATSRSRGASAELAEVWQRDFDETLRILEPYGKPPDSTTSPQNDLWTDVWSTLAFERTNFYHTRARVKAAAEAKAKAAGVRDPVESISEKAQRGDYSMLIESATVGQNSKAIRDLTEHAKSDPLAVHALQAVQSYWRLQANAPAVPSLGISIKNLFLELLETSLEGLATERDHPV